MEENAFWELIDQSRQSAASRDERSAWLVNTLAGQPVSEIIGFDVRLDEAKSKAMTWLMWGAAHRILGWCSDDGFIDFRAWLVGLGRDSFRRATTDPDELAAFAQVQALSGCERRDWAEDEWPAWETLNYVAARAFEAAHGDHEDFYALYEQAVADRERIPVLTDERWDFDDPHQAARRLARLTTLFPFTDAQRSRAFDQQLASRGQTPADFFFGNSASGTTGNAS